MAHIKSRKHAAAPQSRLSTPTLATLAGVAGLAWPGVAAAQTTSAEQQLPPVRVQSTQEADYKADTSSSPKFTQPLVDTPQTITVIKKEVLQEQGAVTLSEALRNTPGITFLMGENGNTQSGDSIVLRGFDTQGSIFVDGIRDLGTITRDMYNIEQVEVIKGPSGSDYGRGAPSGSINLGTKLPLGENFVAGSAAVGTADRYRVTADLNRALDLGLPGTSVRLNVMKEGGDVPGRDHVDKRAWAVAPAIAFGLGTPARAYVYASHISQNGRPDGGIPTIGLPGFYNQQLANNGVTNPARVDTENFYGSILDFDRVKADMVTARFEFDLKPGTTVRNTSRYGRSEQYRSVTSVIGLFPANGPTPDFSDPSTWSVARNRADGSNRNSDGGQSKFQTNDILTNQTNLTTTFDTGPVKHDLSTGFELIYEKQNRKQLAGATGVPNGTAAPAANLYNPDPYFALPTYSPHTNGNFDKGETTTAAVYAFDTITLTPQWLLTGGIRLERYKTEFSNNRVLQPAFGTTAEIPASSLNLETSDNLFSWKLGTVFKPATNGSVYLAYAVSQQPPGGANFLLSDLNSSGNNPNLDPQEGSNIELGTKWDLLGGRLALTGAIYRSQNKKELLEIGDGEYAQVGKRQVQGVELGAVGAITPNWNLSAGYAFMDSEIKRGTALNTGGILQWTPRHTFTAWTTYRLPVGLTLGGGARFVDSIARSSNTSFATPPAGVVEVDSYWVFDAMAAYAINRNVSLQLNVYNLFDKDYVARVNNGGGRYYPGVPRSAMLSANFRF